MLKWTADLKYLQTFDRGGIENFKMTVMTVQIFRINAYLIAFLHAISVCSLILACK